MSNTDEHGLLTVPEAALAMRLSAPTVRRLIREGVLPTVQVGGPGHALRIRRTDLERLLRSRPKAAA